MVFLTGVPGAGKTLAGLNIVHNAVDRGLSNEGDVVYLSGNTPLVVVLREALARDQHRRITQRGESTTLRDTRASTRATIQHINDSLKEYVHGSAAPPSGHVIVSALSQRGTLRWSTFAPSEVLGETRGAHSVGPLPAVVTVQPTPALHLDIPMRAFRSPDSGQWIDALLAGDAGKARAIAGQMAYPIRLTRSLEGAKAWLKQSTLGERRMGLLASSGARRLRADGVGETLSAMDGSSIAHWYLNPPGDIRSSFALEVPANEYTSQGLELDFACLCWGGDLIRRRDVWVARSLAGNRWNTIKDSQRGAMILNSYRVLLSRAREGLVIWVPTGDIEDGTRSPGELDEIAEFISLASGLTIGAD